jgi:hypothetical protein
MGHWAWGADGDKGRKARAYCGGGGDGPREEIGRSRSLDLFLSRVGRSNCERLRADALADRRGGGPSVLPVEGFPPILNWMDLRRGLPAERAWEVREGREELVVCCCGSSASRDCFGVDSVDMMAGWRGSSGRQGCRAREGLCRCKNGIYMHAVCRE